MSWYVYMVMCSDNSLYTGVTNDLEKRVATHNAGMGARYTKFRLPVQLVWSAPCPNRSSAQSLEANIKALRRQDKIKLVTEKPA